MIRTLRVSCVAVLFVPGLVGLVLAQPPKKPDGLTAPSGELKDPTIPSPKVKDALNPNKGAAPTAPGASRVPIIGLRGRVIVRGRPATVLLEIDNKLYTVSKDSLVSGGGNTILKILEVTSTEVRIEVKPINEVIVLR